MGYRPLRWPLRDCASVAILLDMADLTSDLKNALLATSEDIGAIVRRVIRDELVSLQRVGDPDELLDAHAASQLLGMSPAALRRAAERGRFPVPPIRIGRRLRWRRGDLLLIREQLKEASTKREPKASTKPAQG